MSKYIDYCAPKIRILHELVKHKDKETPSLQLPDELQRAKLLKELSAHDRSVINGYRRRRTVLYDERSNIL